VLQMCRYGFNSRGVDFVAENLASFRKREAADPLRSRGGLVGVNLGKNKTSEDPAGDYVIGVNKLGQYADFLVINVSSPNTPGALPPSCIPTPRRPKCKVESSAHNRSRSLGWGMILCVCVCWGGGGGGAESFYKDRAVSQILPFCPAVSQVLPFCPSPPSPNPSSSTGALMLTESANSRPVTAWTLAIRIHGHFSITSPKPTSTLLAELL